MRHAAASEGVASFKKQLRVVFACLALEMAVLLGAPMRPEEIQELMHQMNQPKVAHVRLPGAARARRRPGDQGDRRARQLTALLSMPIKPRVLVACALPEAGLELLRARLTVDAGRGSNGAWLREHVPGMNGLVNIARGRRPSLPFIPTYTYVLEDVLALFEAVAHCGHELGQLRFQFLVLR